MRQIFAEPNYDKSDDPEFNSYAGFLNDNGKLKMQLVRRATMCNIHDIRTIFDDKRLTALFCIIKPEIFPTH